MTHYVRLLLVLIAASGLILSAACGSAPARTYTTTTTEYSPGGEVADYQVKDGDLIIEELHRVFLDTIIKGEGMFKNANEGLARRTAINLAVAELAAKVQTEVRSNTVIYNNTDVRDVVENSVNALVSNYEIDFAGYDPGSDVYRARVSVRGETLVREIERVIN